MPAIEEMFLEQTAVLWEAAGTDIYGREVVSSDPYEVSVVWTWGRSQSRDAKGNVIAIDATVLIFQEVPVDSVMWLGTLDDLPGTALVPEEDVMVVASCNASPNMKNTETAYDLKLARRGASLPTTV